MDIREILNAQPWAAPPAMKALIRQDKKSPVSNHKNHVVKINRVRVADEIFYNIIVEGMYIEQVVLTQKEFFGFLSNIEVVATYPMIVEKTSMLELCYRTDLVMEKAYIINFSGWKTKTVILTIRDLINIYKTAQLLVKYSDPFYPKDK